MNSVRQDFSIFSRFIPIYCKRKVVFIASHFEDYKNWQVERLMFRRGVLQKRIWHSSMVGLSAFGIITSGVFGNQTIISASFPGVGGEDPRFANNFELSSNDPVLNSLYDTRTNISQKPRSEIIEYEVKSGDTTSSIAIKFNISTETIKWANDLDNIHSIKPGQKLKILPVSGVSHVVKSGDNLESVAKKYSAEQQAILDFPFNDIPDDFKLKIGQVLIVPDGTPPTAPVKPKPVSQYSAQSPSSSPTFIAPGGGSFIWPTQGLVTQSFSWYHPGDDIANRASPAITASDGGMVVVAGWPDNSGYGNRVVIDHGNGYKTLYAHMSNIYIDVGQKVSRGQTIGQMGSTGRSTGIHLHFEIRYKDINLNPLAILK